MGKDPVVSIMVALVLGPGLESRFERSIVVRRLIEICFVLVR